MSFHTEQSQWPELRILILFMDHTNFQIILQLILGGFLQYLIEYMTHTFTLPKLLLNMTFGLLISHPSLFVTQHLGNGHTSGKLSS